MKGLSFDLTTLTAPVTFFAIISKIIVIGTSMTLY